MSLEMHARFTPGQVLEERDFYIPDYLAGNARPDLYAAADDAAGELRKAERLLDDSLNLTATLRAAMGEAGDSRAMQVDTVLKLVEQLLNQAHTAIDRHDTRFLNLFMAYFDREGNPAAGKE